MQPCPSKDSKRQVQVDKRALFFFWWNLPDGGFILFVQGRGDDRSDYGCYPSTYTETTEYETWHLWIRPCRI